MTAGNKIYGLRTALNLTQEKLGELVGTSRQTISKWELDLAFPEPAKLITLCRTLGISTDELLSCFEEENPVSGGYGVYRDDNHEVVITSRYALEYYSDGRRLGACLYAGDEKRKSLLAVCEYDSENKSTSYAYKTNNGKNVYEGDTLCNRLGALFDSSRAGRMKLIEPIYIGNSEIPLPYVGEKSVSQCLSAWRNRSILHSDSDSLDFTLCTNKLEYVFSIVRSENNIYCGASNNQVFDMGLIGGRQYFRLRAYKDNSAPFCAFSCDFGYMPALLKLTECVTDTSDAVRCNITGGRNLGSSNFVYFIKRFCRDEIVLAGCGGDEYYYHRDEPYSERIMS